MESQLDIKAFQSMQHKGGSSINKLLNINDNKDTFSFDEYRNAIENERIKQQNLIQMNNEELLSRQEAKRFKQFNDPVLVEKNKKILKHVMTERIKRTLSKNIRNHHNEIFEAQQYVQQYNSTGGKPKDNNWNINNIDFETSENGSQITRVIIRKKRGDKQNELIVPNL